MVPLGATETDTPSVNHPGAANKGGLGPGGVVGNATTLAVRASLRRDRPQCFYSSRGGHKAVRRYGLDLPLASALPHAALSPRRLRAICPPRTRPGGP